MTQYRNPALFIMKYDIPFNFDMGWEDFDAMYHEPNKPFPSLVGSSDPCTWSEEFKAEVNRQRDEWVALYGRWCRGEDDEATITP